MKSERREEKRKNLLRLHGTLGKSLLSENESQSYGGIRCILFLLRREEKRREEKREEKRREERREKRREKRREEKNREEKRREE